MNDAAWTPGANSETSLDVLRWSAEHQELWQNLSQLSLDDPTTPLSFSRRLAKENGWSGSYTRRVVEEYRRFLFLCMSAGHVCCPSDQVDQAWHLHLTYTRSYWNNLCLGVLKRPLHHEATRGGTAEQQKHACLYEQTLASYAQFFEQSPPDDIWPAADVRFGRDIHFRRVNAATHWVLPNPLLAFRQLSSTVRRIVSGLLLTVALMPLAAETWNPFDLRGPQFLLLYVVVFVLGLTAAILVRRSIYQGRPGAEQTKLTPYEAACLAQSPVVAIGAAICRMVHDNNLQILEPSDSAKTLERRFAAAKPPQRNADPLEHAVYAAAESCRDGLTFSELHTACATATEQLEDSLRDKELKPSKDAHPLKLLPMVIMLAVLGFGLIKIGVGINRHKNVGFLIMMCIGTLITAFVVAGRPKRTQAGKRAVARNQKQASKLKSKVKKSDITGEQLALAIGMYGLTMVTAPHLTGIQESWRAAFPPSSGGTGGCSTSGCGASGCGGGGCGGGCGGCGGD